MCGPFSITTFAFVVGCFAGNEEDVESGFGSREFLGNGFGSLDDPEVEDFSLNDEFVFDLDFFEDLADGFAGISRAQCGPPGCNRHRSGFRTSS